MELKNILNELKQNDIEIEATWSKYRRLCAKRHNLRDDVVNCVTMEDLRPVSATDLRIGNYVFGKTDDEFYILVIDEVIDTGDIEFNGFV